jgi:NAD(P)H-dependent flavin oxidoreductase YrpB (nitropropane dioxygenase family)
MPIIETALTRLLGIEHPILLAPMGSAAGGRLAAAVANAGGLGMIGSGYCGDIPPGQPDFLTPYLRAIFATIGISLVEFLRLEGLSRGLEAVAQALDRANTWIEQRLPGLLR